MKKAINLNIGKLVILCLTASLILLLITGAKGLYDEFDDYYSYSYSEDTISWAVSDQDYASLARGAYIVDITGAKVSDLVDDYLDIGRYYEAAKLYHAYQTDGNTEKAGQYLSLMESYADGNALLKEHVEPIRELLGITE